MVFAGCDQDTTLTVEVEDAVYTGEEVKPLLTVMAGGKQLVFGEDFTTKWQNNVEAGEGSVTVYGAGAYSGAATTTFTIAPADIDTLDVRIEKAQYNGKAQKPQVSIKQGDKLLEEGVDYTFKHKKAVNAGKTKIAIKGKGNYSGVHKENFTIDPRPLDDAKIESIEAQAYSRSPIEPEVSVSCDDVKLEKDVDYTVSYKGNDAAGIAKVVVKGIGNYTGKKADTFEITPKSIKELSIAPIPSQAYNGLAVEPDVIVTDGDYMLERGKDYVVVYLSNDDRGQAQAIIRGQGNYADSEALTFMIDNAGDTIARAACRVAYSRGVYYSGGKNGSHPYTAVWRQVYSKVCPGSPWIRSCIAAVKGIVRWSGYDPTFPMPGGYPSKSYENYLRARPGQWQILGTWDGKLDSLRPGDILTSQRNGVIGGNNTSDHSFIYVGYDIAKEVYDEYLRGTDADLGEPVADSAFVCSHGGGGLQSSRSSAPCICTPKFALAYSKSYVVIRPVGSV